MTTASADDAPDPYLATLERLRSAARRPMRYRTKANYRRTIPARDRVFFERAWAALRLGGELLPEPGPPRHGRPHLTRYFAADRIA